MNPQSTTQARTINVIEHIDNNPISFFQWRIFFLCMLIAAVDGYDAQVIAFVAADVKTLFHINPNLMGWLFSSSLIGLTIGAIGFSPLADRIGRKPVIILSCLIMGVFCLLTAFSQSFTHLVLLRFLTGLGLGGAMPNINTLTAEYSPARKRATLMTLMFAGFPLGAALGGVVSAKLLNIYGWQSVFILGGLLPLLLVAILLVYMPESLRYMATKSPEKTIIGRYLAKISKHYTPESTDIYSAEHHGDENQPTDSQPKHLFTNGRAPITVLLWALFFCNLLVMYSLFNWLPSVMSDAGLTRDEGIFVTVVFNMGGIVGGLFLATMIDRFGPYRILMSAYIIAALAIGFIGYSTSVMALIYLFGFLAGATIIGGQFCINALAVNFYPTSIRSTGLGWALAFGRIGAILGPVLVGLALAMTLQLSELLLAIAAPALVCTGVIYLLSKTKG